MAYSAAITGHRPERITNWQFVHHQLALALQDNKIDVMIQGMAAGVDLHSAMVAHNIHIPYICARPWKGHKPRRADEINYEKALQHAHGVVNVTDYEDYPGAWVYQKRNEYMVDNADMLIAVWDGSSGGTANCVKYALKKEVPIWRIDPTTHKVGWYDPKA